MPDHPDHDPLPVSRARRWVASAVLFLAVAGLGLGLSAWKRASLDAEAEAAASQPEPAQAIGAEPARARRHQPATTAIGTVLALRSITLENELAGTVRTVDLPVGGVVEAGAVLVALDVAVEEAELAALEAQADLAGTLLGRMQRAHEKNGASEADVDRARAERDVALANVARTRAVIERKTVRAPVRARVGIADVHPGQYLEQGTRLTTLQGVDAAVHVDFTVVQDVAAALSVGDEVLVGFAMESIDEWLEHGGEQTPGLVGVHSMADGIVLGALNSFANPNARASATDLVIAGPGDLEVRLTSAGKVAIGNGSAELLDLLDQVLTALLATTVATALGPQPLSTAIGGAASTLGAIQTALAGIKV
jgi:multidrug efflux pump subunit AcrA (membrane-fusion protein)